MAAKQGKPILVGVLLKKNNWFMKQERIFELYASGEIKYFTNDPKREPKGSFHLTKTSRAKKVSRHEVELNLPDVDRVVILL